VDEEVVLVTPLRSLREFKKNLGDP
jgi:hypothetical protein